MTSVKRIPKPRDFSLKRVLSVHLLLFVYLALMCAVGSPENECIELCIKPADMCMKLIKFIS